MKFVKKFFEFVIKLEIRVEPLIFLLSACNTAIQVMTPSLSEDKMRRVYDLPLNLRNDTDANIKKFYNKKMVYWDQQYEYVNLPIACVVGVIYGGYGDYYGRKLPLLVGVFSVVVETGIRILIWNENTEWPLELLYPLAVVVGCFGDFLMVMSSVNAYVTDQFPVKSMLSIRIVVVSIIFSCGNFVGSQLTDVVLYHLSKMVLLYIVEGFYVFIILLGLVILDNPKLKHRTDNDSVPRITPMTLLSESFLSLWGAVKIFVKPREGHRRIFLYLCFFANFLDNLVFGELKSLVGTYSRLYPFNWDTHEYAKYRSARPIVQIIGMLLGVLLLKRKFRLKDTLVIVLAILSMGLCSTVIGLAQSSLMIFLSLPVGSLNGMLNPLTYAFLSCIVAEDEIGKAFAIGSIAQKAAGIAQSAVLQNIYTATLNWYQGFVWLCMGLLSFISVGVYTIVHFIAVKEGIQSDF